MANEPWLKFFASDYLLDARVDALPLEAQAILIRMWCLCHIEGSCPADSEEIARKARLGFRCVLAYREQLCRFFELRDGRLYSRRMEAERQKSEAARDKANRRWRDNAKGNAGGNAECNAQSQSQSQKETPPPSQESALEISLQKKNKGFSQSDFDEEALRLFAKERAKVELQLNNGGGSNLSDEEVFDHICLRIGRTPQRMREIFERVDRGASA